MDNLEAQKKLKFYNDKAQMVHLKLENDAFRNGSILHIGADFCLINELKFGEIMVFYSEILDVIPYREKE